MKQLYELFKKHKITAVTDDTRKVIEGSIFVAIKGEHFDGEKAVIEMKMHEKGVAAVICENDLGLGEQQVLVENARLAYAKACSLFHGEPTKKLKLIAVTGTNGKTTTATLIQFILEQNGHKCGFIGTTCYDTSGQIYESHLSTPRQDDLYRLFAEMVQNGAEYCVMEASSQALAQYRIAGETFENGIFTNLTQDHLDWHKTMEKYFEAKKMLFPMCKSAVICTDDKYGARLYTQLQADENIKATSYSINDIADFFAVNAKTASAFVSYWLNDAVSQKSFPLKFNMPGRFNIANSMAAVAACKAVGIDVSESVIALEAFKGVRGRCEVIQTGGFTVICDYAHTEDALEKILTCVREFATRRIICVFGAAGERDAEKRPKMGAVVEKYADYLVIASDNPRFEDPQKIIDEVEKGCKNKTPRKTFVCRKEAIEFALGIAEKEDVILLAGKGHETYQVIGDDEQDFDEREIVAEFVNKEN